MVLPSMTDSTNGASSNLPVRTSELFNAPDADVVFHSSDNVQFRLHKKNLECTTGAFPPAETPTSPDEIVQLIESASTLEIMFQFIYPRPTPDLCKMDFQPLMLLAEAAEKYAVFALISSCRYSLKSFLNAYPVQILKFAARHDYNEIVEELAPILLDIPLSELPDSLPSHIYKQWSIYRERWMMALVHAVRAPQHKCGQWSNILPDILSSISSVNLSQLRSLRYVDLIFEEYETPYARHPHSNRLPKCCFRDLHEWKAKIMNEVAAIPPFMLP
ncbi:hypothetical protein J3R30DRAFT_2110476 [Lentinula aciculospora]|uniref:BTB domain-containing protein n=1 Tax=Lentinula aciculospora TaxID=153920 RepID=A0A9W9DSB9_9AGAR|nr:hypothetical protein J3R30DRAFT_2110476 [Lentinula aciculospora]